MSTSRMITRSGILSRTLLHRFHRTFLCDHQNQLHLIPAWAQGSSLAAQASRCVRPLLTNSSFHSGCPQWQGQDIAPTVTSNPEVLSSSLATKENTGEIMDADGFFEDSLSEGTSSLLRFDSTPYNELPIIHIKATYNNTHLSISDHNGRTVARSSCGTEGFKNAKKGTAIAAQTAAIAAAQKALDKGMTTVRVVVKGLGPGRQSSIKGLQMGGLDIVSITDNTPVPHNGCRPRKARRL